MRQGGSIPARAGEPGAKRGSTAPFSVYPRACGGTWSQARIHRSILGLSPRVRGNHYDGKLIKLSMRSIPARAGEPPCQTNRQCLRWVYPRACGGTGAVRTANAAQTGLSPRVRGNQGFTPTQTRMQRSIPARAGEPGLRPSSNTRGTVYPRACGGTRAGRITSRSIFGLSPRVRGNLRDEDVRTFWLRSIPARAGEPGAFSTAIPFQWVYPRACGGTGWFTSPVASG